MGDVDDRDDLIGERLLLWFDGVEAPADLLALIGRQALGGVTLYRHLNGAPPARARALTAQLQAAARAAGRPPLLIGADQEGGQLQAMAGTTAFPGAMALGAAGDPALARRVGAAIGAELAALGVNIAYAPVCDVNSDLRNPVIGVRAFGDEPAAVAAMAAAMAAGLQSAGVAATAKHFPGHGDSIADSHYGLASLPHPMGRLAAIELPPFAAAIAAGAQLVMVGHLALPALGEPARPATRSPQAIALLRDRLGFGGVVVSDALDMAAFCPPESFGPALAEAALAGVDLLLLGQGNDPAAALAALRAADLPAAGLRAAAGRIRALKAWLAGQPQPDLAVVGCAEHRALAAEVAARALTLVRDRAGRLPLRLPADARIAAVLPAAADLTPADTSSYERPDLAAELRRYHPRVDALAISADPPPAEVAALLAALAGYDLIVVGTINAGARPGQAALVQELSRRDAPLISVALRLPTDLAAYPAAATHLCTYSIQPPALAALAAGLWGAAPIGGRLPLRLPEGAPA